MNWHEDETNIEEIAISAFKNRTVGKAKCCHSPEIHIHAVAGMMSRARNDIGNVWAWCSSCGAYSHVDGIIIPQNWENNSEIDVKKLSATPTYLETVKGIVDKHFERFLKND